MKRNQAIKFGEYPGHETAQEMKVAVRKATIVSVNADAAPNTLRISLQWQGSHDISDFDLQQFGKVLQIQDETDNTGWAIIERPFRVPVAHGIPGWATAESTSSPNPGDTIALRPDLQNKASSKAY
ncbi:MAG: hypothetical protein JOZ08_18265 [Verrucomicrobia bacterium]|nr:hypothetical protein [Verrucomicrobiota bacterium]